MESGYSLADIASVANNDSAFGGNNAWVLILLFLVIFGFGGNGFGRNDSFANFATAASQNELLAGQHFDSLSRQINATADGICSSTYALNNAIVNEGRSTNSAIASGFANLQNCCCDLKYSMAEQFANSNANTTAQIQSVKDMLAQNKIETLQSQLGTVQNQLALQTALCGVPKVNPYMYGIQPYCNCANI